MLLRCRIPLAHFDLDIDVSFDARVASIFGPSGSGKTTLLDAIAGLRDITAGEIEIDGKHAFLRRLAALIDRRENEVSATSPRRVHFSRIFRCGKIFFSVPSARPNRHIAPESSYRTC